MVNWNTLIHRVALKNHIEDRKVKLACDAAFRFLKDVAMHEHRNLRLTGLGIFALGRDKKKYKSYVRKIERDSGGLEQLCD
jgi:nucleoid DNA-binding protein